jgi:hypothetical protein
MAEGDGRRGELCATCLKTKNGTVVVCRSKRGKDEQESTLQGARPVRTDRPRADDPSCSRQALAKRIQLMLAVAQSSQCRSQNSTS